MKEMQFRGVDKRKYPPDSQGKCNEKGEEDR